MTDSDFTPETTEPQKQEPNKKPVVNPIRLSGFSLMLIACLSLLLGQTASILFGNCAQSSGLDGMIFRLAVGFGHLAFPLFSFLMVQDVLKNGNILQKAAVCLGLAIICQIPFSLACYGQIFSFEKTNMAFTLLLGLISIFLCERSKIAGRGSRLLPWFMMIPCVYVCFYAGAYLLHCEYGGMGVLMITYFYLLDEKPVWRDVLFIVQAALFGVTGTASILDVPLFHFWNGEIGSGFEKMKYVFLIYYPLLLSILWGIKTVISG